MLFAKWAATSSINMDDKRQIDAPMEAEAQKVASNLSLFLSSSFIRLL